MFEGLRTMLRGYGDQSHDWLGEHPRARHQSKEALQDSDGNVLGYAVTYRDPQSGDAAVYTTDALGNVTNKQVIS